MMVVANKSCKLKSVKNWNWKRLKKKFSPNISGEIIRPLAITRKNQKVSGKQIKAQSRPNGRGY